MTTPTITLYPDTLPAKGQANAAFNTNVDNFLTWQTVTNGPELAAMITWTQGVANNVLATALAGDLPPLTGEALNFIRANAAEDGGEFRTPAEVLSDIGAASAANLALKAPLNDPILTGTVTAPTPTAGNNSDIVATTAFVDDAIAAIPEVDVATATAALAVGAVGTYAILQVNGSNDNTQRVAGSTVAGSALLYSNVRADTNGVPSGSWRVMGYISASTNTSDNTTLMLRIS